jgi:Na+-transporting methylmalonyl-CoA/oxaloacetate decarboxylase gamma subunit
MKKLKEFLDLLVSFTKAWPIILSVLLLIFSAIVGVSEFAGRSFEFSLPLWAVLFILALTAYPIGKLIEFIVLRRKAPLKLVGGLLWKAPFLSIGAPTAICPRQGCGHEVICKEIPPPQFHVITPRNNIQQANFEYSYQYECPIHGRIGGIPNEPMELLQRKAKIVFK